MLRQIRKRIKVKGIVQGVGFRPFVYRLAHDLRLKGFVRNTTAGVDIEIQGSAGQIAQFMKNLYRQKPQAARIDAVQQIDLPMRLDQRFVIKKSKVSKGFTQISPDIATCPECLPELANPKDRRFGFPFINCTNCGPRYSIVFATPYDRKRTTMRSFKMCPDCAREFALVSDRRFHAQPDCCSVCGPKLSLYTIKGEKIKTGDPIRSAAQLLKKGRIIAIKGLGGFHIACDATNQRAVTKLRRLKNRPTKPLAIMCREQDLGRIVDINALERKIINSPVAPIMLLKKRRGIICPAVAPQNPYLGVMVPYAPIHHLLFDKIPYLVMTSANIQDEPLVKDDTEVMKKLGAMVSHFLTHNRKIENRCDDSIGFFLPKKGFSIIRRSRGYAPVPIYLPILVRPTLAVGPYLKNTFTLAHRKEAYVSPHIGDLDNLETMIFFREMVAKYKRWFRIQPELIVYDLHPDYMTTKLALSMHGKKVGVQHHMAHIASCLGENNVMDRVIGIAFDGTGFGLDGKVWGGEFFVGDLGNLKRVAHLEYLPLPGGEVSIKKPYRIAMAYLYKLLGKKVFDRLIANMGQSRLSLRRANLSRAESRERRSNLKDSQEAQAIQSMIDQDRNLVYTSSMGRLFDCVSAMLGITREITYEAEAAINLEYVANQTVRDYYSYRTEDVGTYLIRVSDLLNEILADIKKGIPQSTISAKFHNTVAQFSLDIAEKLSKIYGVKKVCLSGGVFQNRFLLNLMINILERANFKVYVHRVLPTNDGCISYGQVIVGNLMDSRH